MGIIPPLYLTAIKCRFPSIRRKAISLLSSSPRREGMWDAFLAVKVAEKVMTIEEEGLKGSHIPPERSRIHDTVIDADMSPDPYQHLVVFKLKPNGINGEWHSRQEYVSAWPRVWQNVYSSTTPTSLKRYAWQSSTTPDQRSNPGSVAKLDGPVQKGSFWPNGGL